MSTDPYAQPTFTDCEHVYGIRVRDDVSDGQRLQALIGLMERAPVNGSFKFHHHRDYDIVLDEALDVYTVRW